MISKFHKVQDVLEMKMSLIMEKMKFMMDKCKNQEQRKEEYPQPWERSVMPLKILTASDKRESSENILEGNFIHGLQPETRAEVVELQPNGLA